MKELDSITVSWSLKADANVLPCNEPPLPGHYLVIMNHISKLSESITTLWCLLGLWKEGGASKCAEYLYFM